MSYESWHQEHAKKHAFVMKKLQHLSDDEVIEYFDFENMVKNEPDFCILYKENQKCHDLKELNCYFCACPNFRVGESKSFCSINSKDGGSMEHNGYIHQDCSKCTVPHHKSYVKTHFNRDWSKVLCDTFSSKSS